MVESKPEESSNCRRVNMKELFPGTKAVPIHQLTELAQFEFRRHGIRADLPANHIFRDDEYRIYFKKEPATGQLGFNTIYIRPFLEAGIWDRTEKCAVAWKDHEYSNNPDYQVSITLGIYCKLKHIGEYTQKMDYIVHYKSADICHPVSLMYKFDNSSLIPVNVELRDWPDISESK